MFTILDNSITQAHLQWFFQGSNPLPEFQMPTPLNRKRYGLPSYEDRLSDFIRINFINLPGIDGQKLLNKKNTVPPIPPRGIKPDIIRYTNEPKRSGTPYLSFHGVLIRDYVEFGHNYICQPFFYPANKILMNYAKVMRKLNAVSHFGYFYHVMIISDPIHVDTKAGHLIDLYGIPNNLIDRQSLQIPLINQIYSEIQRMVDGINPHLKFTIKQIDWPEINPQLKTHVIILGPLFPKDRFQLWTNANQSPVFHRYEIHNQRREVYKRFFNEE